jgi:hypothetical protein
MELGAQVDACNRRTSASPTGVGFSTSKIICATCGAWAFLLFYNAAQLLRNPRK